MKALADGSSDTRGHSSRLRSSSIRVVIMSTSMVLLDLLLTQVRILGTHRHIIPRMVVEVESFVVSYEYQVKITI